MRYLKTTGRECQIFISTHSTNFLDTAEMRNVYLISKNDSTKVQLINTVEAESVIPRELGIRISSLFMFDKLVFVEGPSDEGVLREWASVLSINLAQASVGFVPMGGVRNLAYFATERILDLLTKRRVLMWFIIDRDEREEEEIKKIKERLGSQAGLIVLKRRELENYLISSSAIADFVQFKRGLGDAKDRSRPDDQEITKAIEDCANKLKDIALERRVAQWACKPLYLNRAKLLAVVSGTDIGKRVGSELESLKATITEKIDNLDNIIDKERRSLEALWAQEKTHLVPGDTLLDEVCKQFGVRFVKGKDSVQIASRMKKEELAEEMRTLLEDIYAGRTNRYL